MHFKEMIELASPNDPRQLRTAEGGDEDKAAEGRTGDSYDRRG